MFAEIFRFELRFHTRQYLFYVLCGVFFLMMFLATATPNVQMVGGVANVHINSPYRILMTLTNLSFIVFTGGIAYCANAVIRDFELGTAELYLSTPVTRFSYLYGRLLGAVIIVVLLYLAGTLGALVGEFMPWLDPERLGPFNLQAYWFAFWAIALPNILVFSAVYFCLATITRSMMATYLGMIGLLMLTFLLDTFTDKDTIATTSILDPFAATALELSTRYWTVFMKNQDLPKLAGPLLANRVLWTLVGVAFVALVYPLTSRSVDVARFRRKRKNLVEMPDSIPAPTSVGDFKADTRFDLRAQFSQYLSQTRIEVRNILFSVPFLVLLLLGLFLVVANGMVGSNSIFGTPVYPTTALMVAIINGAFSLSLVAVLVYYAGELMVREKSRQVNLLMDAMPWPNWIMIAAKLSGLTLVIMGMLCVAALAGISVQLFKGFYDIQLLGYAEGLLFFFQFPLYLMMVLAVFFYVITRNKYAAMFGMVLYVVASISLPKLGFEDYLYRLSELYPPYSDFTGYSQNLEPYLWQTLYYFFFGCLLLILVHLLWPRGAEDIWSTRVAVMRQRMTLPVVVCLWAVTTAWVLTGGWIYYNTHIINQYTTTREREKLRAEYEKQYKQYEFQPQLEIRKVDANVDIYPERRDVHIEGKYLLANESKAPIRQLHISYPTYLKIRQLDVPGIKLVKDDKKLGYRIYRFDTPLAPGDTRTLRFVVDWDTPGFANNGHSRMVAENGTFFDNTQAFPSIGYQKRRELIDNNKRREYGLDPVERAAKIDDKTAWNRAPLGSNRRVSFEARVSTSADQIAIAPGYLQKEWVEKGRRYFQYKMDQPIWNFYSFVSANYRVKKARWHDVDIEVYYVHEYNVDTMIRAVKRSLDYYTRHFSPYQYRQFRILEFPRFRGTFAQSFPNTVPFSEAIGFVADLRDPEKIDYVFYVTAHELAHQWWGHQVLGADVQGGTMLVESLAQYSALMVMEHEYGPSHMKRFLQYELDRYLQGRGGELIEELPLYLVEDQPYIHYRKGSVVLYALKDYIGEDRMDQALARFIRQYAFKGPPYPTSKDLIADIRAVTPEKYQNTVTDLLQKIVLYDLKVDNSTVEALPDGKYQVTINVSARKFDADGNGKETQVPIDDWLDIGVFGQDQGKEKVPEVLYLHKYEIKQDTATFTVIVDKEPVKAGIDPFNKMIDRNPSDNMAAVKSI